MALQIAEQIPGNNLTWQQEFFMALKNKVLGSYCLKFLFHLRFTGAGLAETIPTSAPYQLPTVAFFGCGKARRQVVFNLGQFSDPDTCTAPPHELAR